jgi:regulation of enolase protein 1 (concanavalin A-like superfamily)
MDLCEVKIWDVATGRQLWAATPPIRLGLFGGGPFQQGAQRPIQFSSDGDRLIAAGAAARRLDGIAGGFMGQASFMVWDGAPPPEVKKPAGKEPRTIAGWGDVVDPGGDCTVKGDDGKLTITVPGTVHDLNPNIFKDARGRNAPRVLQSVEGDFTLQVKISGDFEPGTVAASSEQVAFHGGGILLWIDARTYIRVERGVWVDADGTTTCRTPFVEYWKHGDMDGSAVAPIADASLLKGRTAYLRLERRKGEVWARVSADGQSWTDAVAPLNVDLPSAVRVGVDAVNTSKEPFTVEFEELQLIGQPPDGPGGPLDAGK